MKPVILVLALLFGLLQYELWFSKGGIISTWRLNHSIQQQQQVNQKTEKRNEEIIADIHDLKNGKQAVAERARNDMGMIKKGEVFYQVVKK